MYTLLIGPKGLKSSCTHSHRTPLSIVEYSAIHPRTLGLSCPVQQLALANLVQHARHWVMVKEVLWFTQHSAGPCCRIRQAYPQIVFPCVFRQVGHTYTILLSSLVHTVARVTSSTVSEARRNIASCLCTSSWKVAHATRSPILHTVTCAELHSSAGKIRQLQLQMMFASNMRHR